MPSNKKKVSRSGNLKKITDENGVAFVPLEGMSQSARDKQIHNRNVKRPKNIHLVEGEPGDDMDYRQNRQTPGIANEFALSSEIKEANGTDYSNYATEEYFRNLQDSGSASPNTSDEFTNSSSTNNSARGVSESQEDYSSSLSDFTATQNPGNESQAEDFEHPNNELDSEEIDDVVSKSRYSKNAAIMGMLKVKLITLNDLDLVANKKERNSQTTQNSTDNDNSEVENNSGGETGGVPDYPYLVQHPEDPEVYAHPLQAYGRVNDAGINYRLPRLGQKSIMTPRRYYLNQGLNDEIFELKPNVKKNRIVIE